jgi:CheY-like chemotaxis protein
MLLAMDIEALLEEQGCEVLEPASSVKRALSVLETGNPDAALLDMNLNGETSAPVAAVLRERGIPFVVVTGYTGKHREDPMFRDAPLLKKPYASAELVRALVGLLS